MCGIWGQFGKIDKLTPPKLEKIVKRLYHRGPDGHGHYSDEQASLIHTRLSIIDINGGAQPLESHDHRLIGIVNGELYDYESIKTELIKLGVQFQTHSDSEVLLNLFARKGIHALSQVQGEFAFIFYDRQAGKVYFGRDPFGVKPLYLQHTENKLELGSEIKSLLTDQFEINERYIKNYICGINAPLDTAFKGISFLYPGYLYTYDIQNNELSKQQFYTPPFQNKRDFSHEEAFYQVEYTLKKSIKKRLIADVEVGAYLSGGIDSSLTLALMCDLGATPKAFTVSFEDAQYDESQKASRIAQHLGVKHEIIGLNKNNFLSSLKKSILAFESPIVNPHGAAKNLLSSLASSHLKVVLSGEGADELFAGYAHHRLSKLDHYLNAKKISNHSYLCDLFITKRAGIGSQYLCGNNSSFKKEIQDLFNGVYPNQLKRLIDEKNARYLLGKTSKEDILSTAQAIREYANLDGLNLRPGEFNYNLWFDTRMDLLHYILVNLGDRQEMSNSLEGRTPFLDTELAYVSSKVPEKLLLNGLTEKSILKSIAKKYLPQNNAQESKHAFFAPHTYLEQGDGLDFINTYFTEAEKVLPFMDWGKIAKLMSYSKQENLDPQHTQRLKFLLATSSFLYQEIDRTGLSIHVDLKIPKSIKKGINHVSLL